MIPAVYDMTLYRGDTDRKTFKLWADAGKTQPVDLTGVTVEAMVRDKPTGGSVTVRMDCTVTAPNIIDMVLTAAASRSLPLKGFWDLQLTYPSGDITTVLKGSVTTTPDVTYSEAAKLAVVPQKVLRR